MRQHFRWATVAMIVVLVIINYIDRSAVSYAVKPLEAEFGIDHADYGVISSAFSIGYMVFAFLAGPLVDKFGPRRILLVGMVFWSVATAVTPISGGFTGLLLIRIVLGAGEAPCFPAATRVISRWLPSVERGFALALVGGVAVSGSLLIGGPIVTQLIAGLGWRGMFWVLAGLGVLWALVAIGLLYNTPAATTRVSAAERAYIESGQLAEETSERQEKVNWRRILTNRNLWIVGVGYFAWGYIFWAFMYWLPEYLSTSYHLSVKQVGAFTVAPWAAGVVGALIGGVLVDKVYARTGKIRSRFTIMGIALLLAGAALIPIVSAPSLVTAVVFISIGVGCGFVTGGIWWVAAIDAEPSQPGTAAGFADACFALSGVVAPLVMGFIVQSTGTFASGFVVMVVLALLGAGLMLFGTREPARETTEAQTTAA
ncbi:MFS transporter [Nocardia macrotermitis]|uniref:Putative sulfoacetate transporter SauU n=1 Tax=Nocardia macrotermitis TaxID=2585198 RepID=A0A7K0CWD6_9NOCA|nr:MFS transporter [Nocardia macrotermitis]MQY16974.1 putative sulfoacetate transporter SauU [Nocardia macrotermitis]